MNQNNQNKSQQNQFGQNQNNGQSQQQNQGQSRQQNYNQNRQQNNGQSQQQNYGQSRQQNNSQNRQQNYSQSQQQNYGQSQQQNYGQSKQQKFSQNQQQNYGQSQQQNYGQSKQQNYSQNQEQSYGQNLQQNQGQNQQQNQQLSQQQNYGQSQQQNYGQSKQQKQSFNQQQSNGQNQQQYQGQSQQQNDVLSQQQNYGQSQQQNYGQSKQQNQNFNKQQSNGQNQQQYQGQSQQQNDVLSHQQNYGQIQQQNNGQNHQQNYNKSQQQNNDQSQYQNYMANNQYYQPTSNILDPNIDKAQQGDQKKTNQYNFNNQLNQNYNKPQQQFQFQNNTQNQFNNKIQGNPNNLYSNQPQQEISQNYLQNAQQNIVGDNQNKNRKQDKKKKQQKDNKIPEDIDINIEVHAKNNSNQKHFDKQTQHSQINQQKNFNQNSKNAQNNINNKVQIIHPNQNPNPNYNQSDQMNQYVSHQPLQQPQLINEGDANIKDQKKKKNKKQQQQLNQNQESFQMNNINNTNIDVILPPQNQISNQHNHFLMPQVISNNSQPQQFAQQQVQQFQEQHHHNYNVQKNQSDKISDNKYQQIQHQKEGGYFQKNRQNNKNIQQQQGNGNFNKGQIEEQKQQIEMQKNGKNNKPFKKNKNNHQNDFNEKIIKYCKKEFNISLKNEMKNNEINEFYHLQYKHYVGKYIKNQFKNEIYLIMKFIHDQTKENKKKPQFNERMKAFIKNFESMKKSFDNLLSDKLRNIHINDIITQDEATCSVFKKYNKNNNQSYDKEYEEQLKIYKQIQEDYRLSQQLQNQEDQFEDSKSDCDNSDIQSISEATSMASDVANISEFNLTPDQKKEFQKKSSIFLHAFKKCMQIEQNMFKRNLPAYFSASKIIQSVQNQNNPFTLLMGSTGSGKTTQTPQVLYQNLLMSKNFYKVIYCVQPRKINCLSISERVAEEMQCKLGEEVGYIVGFSEFERKFDPKKTKIIFITETLLMDMLVKQNKINKGNSKNKKKNQFQNCSYIILDEVHERSVKADIIMGLAKQIFSNQDQIKFILSSATVNQQKYQEFFKIQNNSIQFVEIPGKLFPTDEQFLDYQGNSVQKVIRHIKVVIDRIEKKQELHNGHILIFMVDGQEIDECIKQATQIPKLDLEKYILLPLHSKIEKEQQELVFKEHYNELTQMKKRKIIFSTNIAETAITINSVTIVIDCGMEKIAKFDPIKNMTVISSCYISKSSALQRKGRAGRTCPGICYKLYTEEEYKSFLIERTPEINRINIESVLLKIIQSGESAREFHYLEKPSIDFLEKSIENIKRLGAISEINGQFSLTEIGKIMSYTELEPYQVKCLIDGCRRGVEDEIINILSVMPEISNFFKIDFNKQQNNSKENSFFKKFNIKNNYNSDFLNYNRLFCEITKNLKSNKCFLKENNMKFTVWHNILANKFNLKKFLSKAKSKFQNEFKPYQNQGENYEVKILKVMLGIYINQISVNSGIKYLGFIDIRTDTAFKIHPSSSFFNTDDRLVFYGCLEDREKTTFAKHISYFDRQWLQDTTVISTEIYNNILKLIDERNENEFHCKIEVSNFMIDQFRKKYSEKIIEKLQKFSNSNRRAKSFLFYDTELCLIKIASSKEGKQMFKDQEIEKEIMNWISKERETHRKQIMITQYKDSPNYAVIGEGYKIYDILLPHEYVKVKIGNLPFILNGKEINKEVIESYFGLKTNQNFNSLTIHKSETKSTAQIQFLTYQSAKQFVEQTNLKIIADNKEIYVTGIPESNNQTINVNEEYSLNIQIPYTKPIRVFMNFENEFDLHKTYDNMINKFGKNNMKKVKRENQRKEQIYSILISNIDIKMNEKDYEKFVVQQLGGFLEVELERQQNRDDDFVIIEDYRVILDSYITSCLPPKDAKQVFINIECGKKGYLQAKMSFPQKELAEKFFLQYENKITKNGKLEITYLNSLNMNIDQDVFDLTKGQYYQVKKEYETFITFDEKKLKEKQVQIEFTAKSHQHNYLLNNIFLQAKNIFKPFNYILDVEYWQLENAFQAQKKKIGELEKQNKIIIKQTPKKSDVRVWFKEIDVKKREYIIQKLEIEFQQILEGKKYISLSKLTNINKVIETLKELKKNNFIREFAQKDKEIVIKGPLGQLYSVISQLNQNYCKKDKNNSVCLICFETKYLERLDQCQCLFCEDCISEYIITSSSEKDIVVCPNHKNHPITLEDTYELINNNEENSIIEKKLNRNIDNWLNQKNKLPKFIRCTSINCDAFFGRVYKRSDQSLLDDEMPIKIRCKECYSQFCLQQTDISKKDSNIHPYHESFNCEDQLNHKLLDKALEELNGKFCPGCHTYIIKNEGCDHMICISCKCHFCWRCCKHFETAADCYKHLNDCKVGIKLK